MRIRHDGAEAWTPDGVTVEVAAGEVLLVLGPSGCGKSTFALALNGLVPHAVPATLEGTVTVDGVDTTGARVAELSEHVGMVFQDPDAQLVTETVLDEVCFGPENQLVPVEETLARAERALRTVGLWDRRADDPTTLSGGGKQRLAIACALALDTPLLVLDEPTANLDPAGAEEVYRVLGELVAGDAAGAHGGGRARSGGDAGSAGGAERAGGVDRVEQAGDAGSAGNADQVERAANTERAGRAVVLVEHNLDAAMGIVDTVLVLDTAGRQVAGGPAREVLRERAEELAELGVWLPTATLAALRLREAGVRVEPLPLTVEELREGVAKAAALAMPTAAPAPAAGSSTAAGSSPTDVSSPTAGSSTITDSPKPGGSSRPASTTTTDSSTAISSSTTNGSPTTDASSQPVFSSTTTDSSRPADSSPPADSSTTTVSSTPAVRVRNLTVHRGRREVLHNVSLTVARGDFVAVVGPNGAGKTTLVQTIAGVTPPPRGTVDLGGLDPSRARVGELTAAVGFVFQNPEHQFVTDSVEDELAYGLRLRRLPAEEVAARVEDMLATLGLGGLREAHPFLLSGGQKRRLSVGTALIAGAPLLVLDEPTFGQDRARAGELLGLLSELNARGTTVIVVTHDLGLAAEHASHVAIVADGRLAAFGATAAVLGDRALLERNGLRQPPLVRAFAGAGVPAGLCGVTRLADLPGAAEAVSAARAAGAAAGAVSTAEAAEAAEAASAAGAADESGSAGAVEADEGLTGTDEEAAGDLTGVEEAAGGLTNDNATAVATKTLPAPDTTPPPTPFLASPAGLLPRLNPLAKVAAILPAWVALLFTRDWLTPLALLLLALLLLLTGARLRAGMLVALLVGTPVVVAVLAVSFGFWTDPSRVADQRVLFSVGGFGYTVGALGVGVATAVRLAALVVLAMVGGATTAGPDLARALTAQLRVPYRIGYTAVAAYRFVPRFGRELAVIRQAQRVRGLAGGRGPVAAVRRGLATVVPLLAGAIRHADRMALAMEARAFGAHATRTERVPSRWRVRDTVFTVAGWAVTVVVLVGAAGA